MAEPSIGDVTSSSDALILPPVMRPALATSELVFTLVVVGSAPDKTDWPKVEEACIALLRAQYYFEAYEVVFRCASSDCQQHCGTFPSDMRVDPSFRAHAILFVGCCLWGDLFVGGAWYHTGEPDQTEHAIAWLRSKLTPFKGVLPTLGFVESQRWAAATGLTMAETLRTLDGHHVVAVNAYSRHPRLPTNRVRASIQCVTRSLLLPPGADGLYPVRLQCAGDRSDGSDGSELQLIDGEKKEVVTVAPRFCELCCSTYEQFFVQICGRPLSCILHWRALLP